MSVIPLQCRVCAAFGASVHYGGLVCGSCKVFFARAITNNLLYVCPREQKCDVFYGERSCRSCRYDKCLAANMKTQEVGRLREIRKTRIVKYELPNIVEKPAKRENTVVPYLDFHSIFSSKNHFKLLPYFVDNSPCEILKGIIQLEKYCDSDDGCTYIPSNFEFNLDCGVLEAIENPDRVCKRTPIGWRPCPSTSSRIIDSLRSHYSRLLLHYLDFVSASLVVKSLNAEDKFSLVTRQMMTTCLLVFAYNAYKTDSKGLLWCAGFEYLPTEEETNDPMHPYMNKMTIELQTHVVDKMRKLSILEEEYVFLKQILLFSSGNILSEHGHDIVRQARRQFETLLVDFIKVEYREEEEAWRTRRICDMFELLPQIEYLSEFSRTYFSFIVSNNIGNMRQNITFDFHLRSGLS